jgi:prepilin-type N-terminal cleavage/methylation domain-containing protein
MQKGFSLIELISVIVISAIVAGIIGSALSTGFFGYFLGASMNPLSNQATIAMTRMSNDLRNAASFTVIGASSVTFKDGANNTYTYTTATCGSSTCLTVNGSTLAEGVTALNFSYYASPTVSGTLSTVKAVNISLTLTGSNTNTITLVNTIYSRNA